MINVERATGSSVAVDPTSIQAPHFSFFDIFAQPNRSGWSQSTIRSLILFVWFLDIFCAAIRNTVFLHQVRSITPPRSTGLYSVFFWRIQDREPCRVHELLLLLTPTDYSQFLEGEGDKSSAKNSRLTHSHFQTLTTEVYRLRVANLTIQCTGDQYSVARHGTVQHSIVQYNETTLDLSGCGMGWGLRPNLKVSEYNRSRVPNDEDMRCSFSSFF